MSAGPKFEFISRNWLRYFHESIGHRCETARLIAPFIKKSAVSALLEKGCPGSMRVLTRFNLTDCRDRVSDLDALRQLMDRGAQIRGVRGLHSKLYVFENRAAILGSANLTLAALRTNHELGVIVRGALPVRNCVDYFDEMWRQAGSNLTAAKLDAWQLEIDEAVKRDRRRGKASMLADYGAKVDRELEDGPPPVAALPVKRQVFVKFFGVAGNRVTLNMPIVETVKGDGSHWACTYPKGKRPRQANDGDIVYFARMVTPNDYRIYGRGLALRHVPGRDDASREEVAVRDWKEQWPHYVRVHHVEFIDSNLSGGVSLYDMLDCLQASAFVTTTENLADGGNTNPRSSLRRRPDIRLAPAGAEWLAEEFDRRIKKHGAIPDRVVESFDMPESASWLPKAGGLLLEFLVSRLEQGEIEIADPETYPGYLDVAKALGFAKKAWGGLGKAVRRNGLDDLDGWLRRFQLPAISGLVVNVGSRRPGDTFFELHGQRPNNERWWRSELKKSANYPWRDLMD